MELKALSSDGKIAYLIKPILKVLQEAGGQLERSEIKERIADLDDQIAEYAEIEKVSKKTGNVYKDFNFRFNFALKNLYIADVLTFTTTSLITLTQKGLYLDIESLDVEKDIFQITKEYWNKSKSKPKKDKHADEIENDHEEVQSEEKIKDEFKDTLLGAIAKMSPKKFEAFSRALLNRMGVEFTEKGVQISNDGGTEALLAAPFAFPVKLVVFLPATLIKKEGPFFLEVFRHTGHSGHLLIAAELPICSRNAEMSKN